MGFHPPPFATDEDRRLHRLCPVRIHRLYIQQTADIRGTVSQLFVTHGPGRAAGRAVSKPTVSRWLLEAIRLAYNSKATDLPGSLRASSWALFRGVSIQEVYDTANWSLSLTFADFYKLDVAAPSSAQAVPGVTDATFSEVSAAAEAESD